MRVKKAHQDTRNRRMAPLHIGTLPCLLNAFSTYLFIILLLLTSLLLPPDAYGAVWLAPEGADPWSGACDDSNCQFATPCTLEGTFSNAATAVCEIYLFEGNYNNKHLTWTQGYLTSGSTKFMPARPGSIDQLHLTLNPGSGVDLFLVDLNMTRSTISFKANAAIQMLRVTTTQSSFNFTSSFANSASLFVSDSSITGANGCPYLFSDFGASGGLSDVFIARSSVKASCPFLTTNTQKGSLVIANTTLEVPQVVKTYGKVLTLLNITDFSTIRTTSSPVFDANLNISKMYNSFLYSSTPSQWTSSIQITNMDLQHSFIRNVQLGTFLGHLTSYSLSIRDCELIDSPVEYRKAGVLENSVFRKEFLPGPVLLIELGASPSSMVIPNIVVSDYGSSDGVPPVLLLAARFNLPSSLDTTKLEIGTNITFEGQLTVRTSIRSTAGKNFLLADTLTPVWTFGQIELPDTVGIWMNGGRFVYLVGPDPTSGITHSDVVQLPPNISVIWKGEDAGMPQQNTVYPIFESTTYSALPHPFDSQESEWLTQLELTPATGKIGIGFRVLETSIPLFPPLAQQTPPSPAFIGCPLPSPGPDFTCSQDGTWVAPSSVTTPSITIPGGSTVSIDGNLTVSTDIVFSGVNSQLHVNGCVVINGVVTVVLTKEDLDRLVKEGQSSRTLVQSLNGNGCVDSTDLSGVAVSTKTPKNCRRVKSSNTGDRSSLSVLFSIDSTRCNIAIIVPSVIGGIIVLAAIVIIAVMVIKKPWAKMSTKPN